MNYPRTIAVFLFALAACALLTACKLPPDLVPTLVQPLADAMGATVQEKLGQMLADGKISEEAYKLAVEAVNFAITEGMKAAKEALGGAAYQFDVDRAMQLGGVLLGSVVGTTTLSRIRRGVGVVTGKPKAAGTAS